MTAVLVGLNTSATYVGVSIAGGIGAWMIPVIGGHNLGYLSGALVLLALVVSELATWRIQHVARSKPAKEVLTA